MYIILTVTGILSPKVEYGSTRPGIEFWHHRKRGKGPVGNYRCHKVYPRPAENACLEIKYRGELRCSAMAGTAARAGGMSKDEKFVIFASSLGTIFEWYDFYLYAVLAPFFAALFFPPGNDTAALLSAFATYAAGFLMRPFGAVIFGRIGDLVGRKYTFLVTIMVMGGATFLVGLLPTFASIGWLAPILLVHAAPAAGPCARRRVRWRRNLCRRACAGRTSAATLPAGFRPPRRSGCSWRCS